MKKIITAVMALLLLVGCGTKTVYVMPDINIDSSDSCPKPLRLNDALPTLKDGKVTEDELAYAVTVYSKNALICYSTVDNYKKAIDEAKSGIKELNSNGGKVK